MDGAMLAYHTLISLVKLLGLAGPEPVFMWCGYDETLEGVGVVPREARKLEYKILRA